MSPKLLNLLFALLPVSLYYGYIEPVYTGNQGLVWTPQTSILVLKAQNEQYKSAADQAALVTTEIDKVNKTYLDLNADIKNKIIMMLPDSIDQFKLRNEVTSIANKKGIAISNLKVTEAVRIKNPSVIGGYKISFNMKGNYATIKSLLEEYEKSTRFFVIESLSITHHVKKDGNGIEIADSAVTEDMLDGEIVFNVYYLKR